MMPPYVEYEYECLCGVWYAGLTPWSQAGHLELCRIYNARRKDELAQSWQETGIARYWREQAESAESHKPLVSQ